MPRASRIVISGYPHHIIQRGHNRQPVFAAAADYVYYLENLRECKEKLGCRVYAYCLMTNHIHLIVDPGEDQNNIAKIMKHVAGRQTRYVNRIDKRSGSLWDGRYKSSAISTDEYLLACCRYVELNPVRAGIVAAPSDYLWSSYRSKVGLDEAGGVDPDPCFMALSDDRHERAERYARWIQDSIPDGEWTLIRQTLQRGQLTGSERFVDEMEKIINRRVEFRGRGRPKKGKP